MKSRIKTLFVLTMLLFVIGTVFAQIPEWQWATSAGGINFDEGSSIVTDDYGNIYVAGVFGGTATFGSFSLTSFGLEDIFVAKLDTNGNWIWANQANGIGWDSAINIDISDTGNIYVTGHFLDTTTFGQYTLTSNGSEDIFCAKLDDEGDWIWATNAGSIDYDRGYDSVIDNNGNNYITGEFSATATFGTTSIISEGYRDIFLAKISSNGNWLWVTQAGGSNLDRGFGVTTNNTGSIYITGEFSDNSNFGSNMLTSNGEFDIFVAKLVNINSIEDHPSIIPNSLSNYPNPFNPSTTISFSIPEEGLVELSVYNVKGQRIKSLLSDHVSAGEHSIVWNGTDNNNKPMSSGVYFYKLNVNGETETVKKCILMK